jgi:hypothetical protein
VTRRVRRWWHRNQSQIQFELSFWTAVAILVVPPALFIVALFAVGPLVEAVQR